ncbi:MAG TPA: penicillin-binding protein 2 [Microbacteriaceae bacterium]|nr:penicillin-binding protein 2 [Microbacteriaceae bacterium]
MKTMRRRTAATVVAIIAFVGILGFKLVDIQVVRASEIKKTSVIGQQVPSTLYGTRGSIVDANGVTLADTVLRYDVQVSPSVAVLDKGAFTKDVNAIGAATGQGGAAVQKIISNALAVNPKSQYALVIKGIDVTKYDKLTALNIPWLHMTRNSTRVYPDGAVAGNLIGFVGSDGKPQAGIESSQNACLAAADGSQTYQQALDGTPIPGTTVTQKPATNGGTVQLTIDSDLQWFAQQQLAQVVPALGAKFGFVTVAEAKTGKLLAVAQYPSVDPNNVGATPPNFWGAMSFSTPFEPGSTFKALTAAALIDTGKATPASQVLTPYTFTSPNGANLHDAGYHAPERLTLTGVLMLSSNVGMSILGQRLSSQDRYNYLKAFGIGSSTGIGFPGESSGQLNPVSTWDDQTKYATMFGQGVSATQIQMVSAYQALANGGVRIPLTLVNGCKNADGTVTKAPQGTPTRVISAQTASTTLGMMESVITKGELAKQLNIPGYRIAGKTGTAQQPDGKGGYLPSYYVSVMGVAPADNPQYVVSVNLGYPTTLTSSAAAAPLFKTIMSQVLKTYRVKPSTSTPPSYSPYY